MRLTAFASRPKKFVGRDFFIPAPTGGWDAISPLANMPPDRAIRLDNWFPQTGYIELRRGYVPHVDTGTGLPVESLMGYQGTQSLKLFAASGGTIFDITQAGISVPDITGLLNARWQHVMFAGTGGHFLWCCNGADDPRYYDGTAWNTAAITGVSGTDLILPVAYKGRIWSVIKNSTKAAYLDLDAVQGAAMEFDVGAEFNQGGYLQSIGVWSTDSNDGPNSYLVFVSSFGEVLVYNIVDPGDADGIQLLSKGAVGAPVGRRCLTQVGADLAIICQDGILPVSQIMAYDRAALINVALTRNIQPVVNRSAKDYFTNFGWQLISYPRGTMAILNVPVLPGVYQEQYVMNTVTGAWCRFTGQNASCWEIYDNRSFFGGNNGIVYEADRAASDVGSTIVADMKGAFNYCGTPGRLKRWTMCQPLVTTDGNVTPSLAVDVDFRDSAQLSASNSFLSAAARWDEAIWDTALWPEDARIVANWLGVSGLGYCASIKMRVSVSGSGNSQSFWDQAIWDASGWDASQSSPFTLQVNSFNLVMEDGTGQFIA